MTQMTGNERLVLSGGLVSDRFIATLITACGIERPRVAIDTSMMLDDQNAETAWDSLSARFKQHRAEPFLLTEHKTTEEKIGAINSSEALFFANGSLGLLASRLPAVIQRTIRQRVAAGKMVGAGAGDGALTWFNLGYVKNYDNGKYQADSGLDIVPAWGVAGPIDSDEKVWYNDLSSSDVQGKLLHKPRGLQAFGFGELGGLAINGGAIEPIDLVSPDQSDDPSAHVYRFVFEPRGGMPSMAVLSGLQSIRG